MTTTAPTETIIRIAAALGVPVPAAIAEIPAAAAWAALQGIARGRADEWNRIARDAGAEQGTALATIAQGYDQLASLAEQQQRANTPAPPAEDMDDRLSSL